LHSLGWSPQKPQRRAVERDEEAKRKIIAEKLPPALAERLSLGI